MDPLQFAMLDTPHGQRERQGLVWSALPSAPVVDDLPRRRVRALRSRLAAALRHVADHVDVEGLSLPSPMRATERPQ